MSIDYGLDMKTVPKWVTVSGPDFAVDEYKFPFKGTVRTMTFVLGHKHRKAQLVAHFNDIPHFFLDYQWNQSECSSVTSVYAFPAEFTRDPCEDPDESDSVTLEVFVIAIGYSAAGSQTGESRESFLCSSQVVGR